MLNIIVCFIILLYWKACDEFVVNQKPFCNRQRPANTSTHTHPHPHPHSFTLYRTHTHTHMNTKPSIAAEISTVNCMAKKVVSKVP